MSCEDLLAMYKCFILPVLDYSAVVYHSMLTKEQSTSLEALQRTAIKIIYGWDKHYEDIIEAGSLERLDERRIRLVDLFILKTTDSSRFK